MNRLVLAMALVGTLSSPAWLSAQEDAGRGGEPEEVHDRREQLSEETQRLRRLKEENPEEFQRVIQARKAKLQERLAHLKETNPEAYQRLTDRMNARREQQLQELKANNPQAYRQLVERRLQELKQTNPERYQQLTERRQQWRQEQLGRLKQTHPESYDRFLQDHPRWAQRPDHDNNPPGPRGGPGTNWENPPGPRGGAGAGPDRGVRDWGRGEGRGGVGQGGEHRSPRAEDAIHGGGRRR